MEPDPQVPPGALPEEVADDVPINASEGEYILPANVVRFIGLDKIEKMVTKAKEQLAQFDAAGRVGGNNPEDDELPFDPAELQGTEEAPPGFAEGGSVGESMFDQGGGYTGVKELKSASGEVRFIPYMNGQPLYPIPPGFSEIPQTPAPPAAAPDTAGQPLSPQAGFVNSDNDPSLNEGSDPSPLASDPSKWSVDNFISFGEQRNDAGTNAIRGMMKTIPGVGLASTLQQRYLDNKTSEMFDQMLETGRDLQGNLIPEDKKLMLSATRENLKQSMSEQSGLNLNPFSKLADAAGKFMDFMGLGQNARPPVTMSSRNSSGAPMSAMGNNTPNSYSSAGDRVGPSSGADGSYGGSAGGRSLGSDMGRDPSDGPSEGSMASGGLYKRGGLVSRRKNC